MATRNINNYINELLNEVHEPGHQRERQFFDPTKNPMDGIRDDQKSTKKPLSSEERELAILRAQAKSRTNDMGERLAARKALKAMENQAAPSAPSAPTTTGGMGKEMDKMRDGFLSNLDNFTSGKGITDNLQASGSGKKPKKDTPGREIEKIPERRPERPEPQRYPGRPDYGPNVRNPGRPDYGGSKYIDMMRPPDDGGPKYIDMMRPPDDGGPKYIDMMPDRRPDDGRRPVAEPKPFFPGRRPDDGRYDDIPKPIGKPIETGTFKKKPRLSKGGKNKRLARAAQADKTGDAYMDQVMGQGKATAQSEYQKRIDAEKDRYNALQRDDARPDSGIRNTLGVYDPNRKYGPPRTTLGVYDPNRKYGPAIPLGRATRERRQGDDLISARMNEAMTDVVHTYPGTAEETPQETPEERAKRERTERFAKDNAAMFAKSRMTRRERIEQNMRDDERESGRRIGAFKHPKPEPKPEKAQPSYEDLLAGPKPKEYTIIYDPDAGKPRKRPNS